MIDKTNIPEILEKLRRQAERKRKYPDGLDSIRDPGQAIQRFTFLAIEELGEVSSALTRSRLELAKAECIDVMHAVLMLYLAIEALEAREAGVEG